MTRQAIKIMNMQSFSFSIVIYMLSMLVTHIMGTEVLRPRGVPLSKKIFYDPSRDFSCLDGSSIVPFNFVNDDYCDCQGEIYLYLYVYSNFINKKVLHLSRRRIGRTGDCCLHQWGVFLYKRWLCSPVHSII